MSEVHTYMLVILSSEQMRIFKTIAKNSAVASEIWHNVRLNKAFQLIRQLNVNLSDKFFDTMNTQTLININK